MQLKCMLLVYISTIIIILIIIIIYTIHLICFPSLYSEMNQNDIRNYMHVLHGRLVLHTFLYVESDVLCNWITKHDQV